MKRPSKKDIKAAVDKLKDKSSDTSGPDNQTVGSLSSKKSNQRIRKQGV
jgi:hypothetical protein